MIDGLKKAEIYNDLEIQGWERHRRGVDEGGEIYTKEIIPGETDVGDLLTTKVVIITENNERVEKEFEYESEAMDVLRYVHEEVLVSLDPSEAQDIVDDMLAEAGE